MGAIANNPVSIQGNYALLTPNLQPKTFEDVASSLTHIQTTFNQLPVDKAFLWQGGGSNVSAANATWTDVKLDGQTFANDGFTVDATNNRIVAKRAGWYAVKYGLFFGAPSGATLNNARIHVTNLTQGSPYAIFGANMDFFSPSNPTQRVGDHTYAPLGAGDYFEIQGFQQSGGALTVDLENLFVSWVRPYRV